MGYRYDEIVSVPTIYAYVDENPVSFYDPLGLAGSPATSLAEAIAEGNVEQIEMLADAAGVNSDEALAQASANANKLIHIFGKAGHNLDPVVKACGSPGKALKILQTAADANFSPAITTVQQFTVTANGVSVVVRGIGLGGAFKIGTAFIP